MQKKGLQCITQEASTYVGVSFPLNVPNSTFPMIFSVTNPLVLLSLYWNLCVGHNNCKDDVYD